MWILHWTIRAGLFRSDFKWCRNLSLIADIWKSTGPRSSTGENSEGPMKTVVVPVLLSGKKNLVGSPSTGTLILTKMSSCKSSGGPVKLGFSMWSPVLRSGKGPKVFPVSVIICFFFIDSLFKVGEWSMPNTVKSRYNTVQYNMIFHTSLQQLRQKITQRLNPQNTPHTSPWWGNLWGVFREYFRDNWPHYNSTALYNVT